MRSLAMSIFLYACETWTITADIERLRRIQVLEMRCFCKHLGISYRGHITNEKVKARIRNASWPYEDLLTSVKDANWSGTGTSQSSGLVKTVLQGTVLFKVGDKEADRGKNGKTTSKSGLTFNGISYCGKPRTARSGGRWLKNLQWCPSGQPDFRIEEIRKEITLLSQHNCLKLECDYLEVAKQSHAKISQTLWPNGTQKFFLFKHRQTEYTAMAEQYKNGIRRYARRGKDCCLLQWVPGNGAWRDSIRFHLWCLELLLRSATTSLEFTILGEMFTYVTAF